MFSIRSVVYNIVVEFHANELMSYVLSIIQNNLISAAISCCNLFNYSRRQQSCEYGVHPRLFVCVCAVNLSVCLSARYN